MVQVPEVEHPYPNACSGCLILSTLVKAFKCVESAEANITRRNKLLLSFLKVDPTYLPYEVLKLQAKKKISNIWLLLLPSS